MIISSMEEVYTTVVEDLDNPFTWNDAAARACYQIIKKFDSTAASTDGSLIMMCRLGSARLLLDVIIGKIMKFHDQSLSPEQRSAIPPLSPEEASRLWENFGFICFETGRELGVFDKPKAFYIDQISDILVRKQRDYGHDNIARFGRTGIAIRLHDKVARLENLTKKNTAPNNESVVDNFIDLIGYAAIGIMWENGWYMKALASEVDSHPVAEESKK